MGVRVIDASGLDASPLYSAISMVHPALRFPADVVGTSMSPQLMPQSTLREESREADRLQLCLNAMEMTLFASERETAAAEAAATKAHAQLAGKALDMIFLFHFVRRSVLSYRVFLSLF